MSDPCLFINKEKQLFLGLYVDDSMLIGPENEEKKFTAELAERFKITDKGQMKKFLGCNVEQTKSGKITATQHDYIRTMLEKIK